MWSQILPGLLGGGFALLGVWFTQRQSDRRELERWQREREREREGWAREDAARSYDHRRDAYIDFMSEWNRYYDIAYRARVLGPGEEPDFDWLVDLYGKLIPVEIFGTGSAAKSARAALKALSDYAYNGTALDHAIFGELQSIVRRDLGVPDYPISGVESPALPHQ